MKREQVKETVQWIESQIQNKTEASPVEHLAYPFIERGGV